MHLDSYSQEYLMFSWMSSDMNGNLKIVDDPNLEEFYWSGFSLHNESFHYKGNGSGKHLTDSQIDSHITKHKSELKIKILSYV